MRERERERERVREREREREGGRKEKEIKRRGENTVYVEIAQCRSIFFFRSMIFMFHLKAHSCLKKSYFM